MTFKNTITTLDIEDSTLDESKVSKALREFIANNNSYKKTDEDIAEEIAFDFSENYPIDESYSWGTYYGPKFVLPNDNGTVTVGPHVNHVTEDTLSYWKNRSQETKNQFLKLRYLDLTVDFSPKVTNSTPEIESITSIVNLTLEIFNKGLFKNEFNIRTKLIRALNLSRKYEKKEESKGLLEAVFKLDEEYGETNKPGTWGFAYEILQEYKKSIKIKGLEKKIVQSIKERYEETSHTDFSQDFFERCTSAERALYILLDHTTKTQQEQEALDYIDKFLELLEVYSTDNSQQIMYLERLLKETNKKGLKNSRSKISTRLRSLEIDNLQNFQKYSQQFSINTQPFFDALHDQITRGIEFGSAFITYFFTPQKANIEDRLKKVFKLDPIQALARKVGFDNAGRKKYEIPSFENDPGLEGHITDHTAHEIRFKSSLLEEGLKILFKTFTEQNLDFIEYLLDTPLIDVKRKHIFRQCLYSFFNKRYYEFLHLVIPQIEHCFRYAVEIRSGEVYFLNEHNGHDLITLNQALNTPQLKELFREDEILYFQTLLNDVRGINLRNEICHGLYESYDLSKQDSFRIIHILLIFKSFQTSE